jgi:transcriptional regulator with XRE-family HTH domain
MGATVTATQQLEEDVTGGALRAAPDGRDVLIGRWSKAIRENRVHVRKITQAQLATELGVSPMAVSKWESGVGIPSDYLKVQLIQHLMLDARALFAPIPVEQKAAS